MLAPLEGKIYEIKVIPGNRSLVEKIGGKYQLLNVISTHFETMKEKIKEKYEAKSIDTKYIGRTEIFAKEGCYTFIVGEKTGYKLYDLFKKRK